MGGEIHRASCLCLFSPGLTLSITAQITPLGAPPRVTGVAPVSRAGARTRERPIAPTAPFVSDLAIGPIARSNAFLSRSRSQALRPWPPVNAPNPIAARQRLGCTAGQKPRAFSSAAKRCQTAACRRSVHRGPTRSLACMICTAPWIGSRPRWKPSARWTWATTWHQMAGSSSRA